MIEISTYLQMDTEYSTSRLSFDTENNRASCNVDIKEMSVTISLGVIYIILVIFRKSNALFWYYYHAHRRFRYQSVVMIN